MLDRTDPVTVRVMWQADIGQSRWLAKDFSTSLGFPPADCEEIALVATELASNLIRHASRGTIQLSRVEVQDKVGIQIKSQDDGPGIADVELAITDGYSTAGGLGLGLGTANRLMDELEIYSGPEAGLHIVCRRWMRPRTTAIVKELAFGVATRSYRRIPENGDAFLIKQWERNALAGVIDGLGHGQFAQRASQTARQYIEHHFDQPLENLFRGAGRACRATRGVVMALARFDLARRKVIVASVGNIEVRLVGSPEKFNLVVRRGIVGLNAPNPVPTEHPWTSNSLLIMHSDGVSTHWDLKDLPEVVQEAPSTMARRLLEAFGKVDDDATIVVAGNAHA